jgi:hypothetical protein
VHESRAARQRRAQQMRHMCLDAPDPETSCAASTTSAMAVFKPSFAPSDRCRSRRAARCVQTPSAWAARLGLDDRAGSDRTPGMDERAFVDAEGGGACRRFAATRLG